jgi:large subunit ribosomal protein L22
MADTATGQEVRAQAKWVRVAPRKARLVVDHIRGRSVPEARTVLAFTERAAAKEIEKVLRSAIANAEANHGLVGDELYVSSAVVDEGPTLKRWRARARGRAARIRKHTCHITVMLAPLPSAPGRPTRRPRRAVEEAEPVKPARTARAAKPKETKPKAAKAEQKPAEDKPKRTRAPRRKKTEEAES